MQQPNQEKIDFPAMNFEERLYLGIKTNNFDMVKQALNAKISLTTTYSGDTPVALAAFYQHCKILYLLLQAIPEPISDDKDDPYQLANALLLVIQAITPEHQMILGTGNVYACFDLLCNKLNAHQLPQLWEESSHSPLYYAVLGNNKRVVDILCHTNFPVTKKQSLFAPALIAARKGYWDLLPSLVTDRPNGKEDYEQYGPTLQLALKANQEQYAALLLKNGKNIKQLDKNICLHIAANNGNLTMLLALIASGADLCFPLNGNSITMILGKKKHVEIIKALVKYVNEHHIQVDQDFWDLSLFWIVQQAASSKLAGFIPSDCRDITKLLIQSGANPAKSYSNHSAFEYASRSWQLQLSPLFYASPAIDIFSNPVPVNSPILYYNNEVLQYISPRLLTMVVGAVDNCSIFSILPMELLRNIALLMMTARYDVDVNIDLKQSLKRQQKTALLQELDAQKILSFSWNLSKPENDLVTGLKKANNGEEIEQQINAYLNAVYFKDAQEQNPHQKIIELLIKYQLTNEKELKRMQVKFQPDIIQRNAKTLCIIDYKNSLIKNWQSLLADQFMRELEQKNSAQEIEHCITQFLNKMHYHGQADALQEMTDLLLKYELITEDFLQALKVQYLEQVSTRTNVQQFLIDFKKSQSFFTWTRSDTVNTLITTLEKEDFVDEIKRCIETFLRRVYSRNEQNDELKKNVITLLQQKGLTDAAFLQQLESTYQESINVGKRAGELLKEYRNTKPLVESSSLVSNFIETLLNMAIEKNYKAILPHIDIFLYSIYSKDMQSNVRESQVIQLLVKCGLVTDKQLTEIIDYHAKNIFMKQQANFFQQKYSARSNQFFKTNVLDLRHLETAQEIKEYVFNFVKNIYQNFDVENNQEVIRLLCQFALISEEDIRHLDEKYPSLQSESVLFASEEANNDFEFMLMSQVPRT